MGKLSLLVSSAVVTCLLISAVTSQAHNFWAGKMYGNESLLYQETFKYIGNPFGIRNTTVTYPSSGKPYPKIITGVRVWDLYSDNKGGYANITKGGIGKKYIGITLRSSAKGRGFNFNVNIFGFK